MGFAALYPSCELSRYRACNAGILNEFRRGHLTLGALDCDMRRQLLVPVLLCATTLYFGWSRAANAVERVNCDNPYDGRLDLVPTGAGPLELAKLFCQRVEINFKEVTMVSPDGRSIMYLQGGTDYSAERKVLHVARLDAHDSWSSYVLNMGGLWQFGQAMGSVPAYGWAADSSGIWTATREKIGPGGINSSGLQPMFISLEDGSARLFDPPRHEAGPLDGLLWSDGNGLALAYFGARGHSYQPLRHDKHPTFAMIDAKRGVILDTLPFDVFEQLEDAFYVTIGNLNNAAVTRLENGKMRAVLSGLHRWVVWTQGEPPRILPNPYPVEERDNKMAISRDGTRLLVARLRCDGGYDEIEESNLQRRPPIPPCKPVEGVIAALYDLDTGRRLWDVRETVLRLNLYPNPAISEDGRYALVGLPYNAPPDPHPQVALISMEDGKIVQRFRSAGSGSLDSIGFLAGDRGVWVSSGGVTALYDLHRRAQ
jgi:hypothetical protein